MKPLFFVAALVAAFVSFPALAQLHDVDIIIEQHGGVIRTGNVDTVTGQADYPRRVFAATFGDFDFVDEPGVDSLDGAFPPGSQIGFDILDGLRVWDGTDFHLLSGPTGPRIHMVFGALDRYTPPDHSVVPGFGISVSGTGQFHRHIGYTLVSQASPPAEPAEAGVYLLQLHLWSNVSGIGTSLPYYMVFNQSSNPAVQDAAVDWTYHRYICAADVGMQGGIPGFDYILDNNDFIVYINYFFSADPKADVGVQGGVEGSDGLFDNNDFVVYINRFFTGCP
jgi:hypothetical protein